MARTCSLIYIVLDVLKPLQHKKLIEKELEGFGIRLNQKPPNIGYKRKDKGGINLTATVSEITVQKSHYPLANHHAIHLEKCLISRS